ncbi:MAG: hypothetical protein J6L92_08195 [Clostridia bacterium]|nr:hypothetical protein [Clostridia bacterium]
MVKKYFEKALFFAVAMVLMLSVVLRQNEVMASNDPIGGNEPPIVDDLPGEGEEPDDIVVPTPTVTPEIPVDYTKKVTMRFYGEKEVDGVPVFLCNDVEDFVITRQDGSSLYCFDLSMDYKSRYGADYSRLMEAWGLDEADIISDEVMLEQMLALKGYKAGRFYVYLADDKVESCINSTYVDGPRNREMCAVGIGGYGLVYFEEQNYILNVNSQNTLEARIAGGAWHDSYVEPQNFEIYNKIGIDSLLTPFNWREEIKKVDTFDGSDFQFADPDAPKVFTVDGTTYDYTKDGVVIVNGVEYPLQPSVASNIKQYYDAKFGVTE